MTGKHNRNCEISREKKKEDKKRMGRLLMVAAQRRKSWKESEAEDGSCRNEIGAVIIDEVEIEGHIRSTNGRARKKMKTKTVYGAEDSLDAFGEHIKDADLARILVERDHLQFERDIAESGREERFQERFERQKEME